MSFLLGHRYSLVLIACPSSSTKTFDCVLAAPCSSDPNCTDRWGATPLDDAFRGGTLYHKYCARLVYGWGGNFGEQGRSNKAKRDFLEDVKRISMEEVRG